MNILAIPASNSSSSINRALINLAAARLTAADPAVTVEIVDINDFEMPIYSSDREAANGVPQLAKDLLALIGGADAVVIAFPEHNGGVPAAWKNIFDWMSRVEFKVWQGKPVVMLSASPGGRAGANVLAGQEAIAGFYAAELVGVQGFGNWGEAWDAETGSFTSHVDLAKLDDVLTKLLPVAA
ncbi:NADPH-dependent FMN reductase [Pacificoceanicola onchidii]|uniref:NADPH-dependent FMN reductase n=1 Tax=Pacificoceanicola onchidii TaxID=2562685 RepID=UPI0010A5711C|nr:NAD(P)H-dependent oxidoreductase [Pacificoceanicola onchidii]